MRISLRTAALTAAACTLAAGAAIAADSYVVSAAYDGFSPEEAVAHTTQVLVAHCEGRGDRAGPVTLNKPVGSDAYGMVFFADMSITCFKN